MRFKIILQYRNGLYIKSWLLYMKFSFNMTIKKVELNRDENSLKL